jgi:hypothetical protein
MIVEIELPDYKALQGIHMVWEEGFTISAQIGPGGAVRIQGDRAGLISLARHLLTLAQEEVPTGSHIHYDQYNSLEDGSCELIFEKR